MSIGVIDTNLRRNDATLLVTDTRFQIAFGRTRSLMEVHAVGESRLKWYGAIRLDPCCVCARLSRRWRCGFRQEHRHTERLTSNLPSKNDENYTLCWLLSVRRNWLQFI